MQQDLRSEMSLSGKVRGRTKAKSETYYDWIVFHKTTLQL